MQVHGSPHLPSWQPQSPRGVEPQPPVVEETRAPAAAPAPESVPAPAHDVTAPPPRQVEGEWLARRAPAPSGARTAGLQAFAFVQGLGDGELLARGGRLDVFA